jgi:hypothetical protein
MARILDEAGQVLDSVKERLRIVAEAGSAEI